MTKFPFQIGDSYLVHDDYGLDTRREAQAGDRLFVANINVCVIGCTGAIIDFESPRSPLLRLTLGESLVFLLPDPATATPTLSLLEPLRQFAISVCQWGLEQRYIASDQAIDRLLFVLCHTCGHASPEAQRCRQLSAMSSALMDVQNFQGVW